MGGRGASSSKIKVMTEEEYLSSKGYGFMDWQDTGMDYLNGRESKRHNKAIMEIRHNKRIEHQEQRTKYRKEYNKLVKEGKIRKPTGYEIALKNSKGNPDNPAVQASKRLVEKYKKIMKERKKK